MQVWALIVDSFRDAVDRKIFWIMVVLSVAIAGSMACIEFDDQGVNILFGTWQIESPAWAAGSEQGRAKIGALLVKIIADLYIGWVGMVLALVCTAGMLPAFMARGAVDIVVSKPVSRYTLFLGKYLGAMVFVLLQASLFVGLTLLVIGTRWHCWLWGYLWLVPLMVLLFSYLFAFCALFGVLTRSALASLLLTLVVWVGIWAPQEMYGVFVMYEDQIDQQRRWQQTLRSIKWVIPKTQDIPLIAGNLINAALVFDIMELDRQMLSEEKAREAERRISDVDAVESIGSSLAVEAVVVMIAMFLFKRKDF